MIINFKQSVARSGLTDQAGLRSLFLSLAIKSETCWSRIINTNSEELIMTSSNQDIVFFKRTLVKRDAVIFWVGWCYAVVHSVLFQSMFFFEKTVTNKRKKSQKY